MNEKTQQDKNVSSYWTDISIDLVQSQSKSEFDKVIVEFCWIYIKIEKARYSEETFRNKKASCSRCQDLL